MTDAADDGIRFGMGNGKHGGAAAPPLTDTRKKRPSLNKAYKQVTTFIIFSSHFTVHRSEITQDSLMIVGCMDSRISPSGLHVLWADEWGSFLPEVTFDAHKGTCCATAAH